MKWLPVISEASELGPKFSPALLGQRAIWQADCSCSQSYLGERRKGYVIRHGYSAPAPFFFSITSEWKLLSWLPSIGSGREKEKQWLAVSFHCHHSNMHFIQRYRIHSSDFLKNYNSFSFALQLYLKCFIFYVLLLTSKNLDFVLILMLSYLTFSNPSAAFFSSEFASVSLLWKIEWYVVIMIVIFLMAMILWKILHYHTWWLNFFFICKMSTLINLNLRKILAF